MGANVHAEGHRAAHSATWVCDLGLPGLLRILAGQSSCCCGAAAVTATVAAVGDCRRVPAISQVSLLVLALLCKMLCQLGCCVVICDYWIMMAS